MPHVKGMITELLHYTIFSAVASIKASLADNSDSVSRCTMPQKSLIFNRWTICSSHLITHHSIETVEVSTLYARHLAKREFSHTDRIDPINCKEKTVKCCQQKF